MSRHRLEALAASLLVAMLAPPALAQNAEAMKPGQAFRDCPECPEMVVIPAGRFMMGSPESEDGRLDLEGPQHAVTIVKPFAVGRYEVTFAEWDACVSDGGCRYEPNDQGWGRGKHPVIRVSWDDITKEYLPWLSRKASNTYRLLTEAEWEYAARAETTTRFHFGNGDNDVCAYGNVGDLFAKEKYKNLESTANCRDGYPNTAPVGLFKPNAFGLHDMLGNVWELVQDCLNETHKRAPTDGSARTAGECRIRMVRGGSWIAGPRFARSAYRGRRAVVDRLNDTGFRVARAL